MDDVSLFIAGISHELRNPLNGLSGNLQLMMHTDLNISQKQYLNSMQNCCVQLIKIVNDILDFSKLSAGTMILSNECFSISSIKNDINDIIGQKLKEKKQKCNYTIAEDIPTYIVLDNQKLIQVIINLISNASKFSNVSTNINVSIIKLTDSKLEISIQDTGFGISKEDIKKLFTKFTQLGIKQGIEGTGLGLIISKKIVELMGGNISVESTLGTGSTFSFIIPYKEVLDYEKEIIKDIKKLKNKTVLVVDDNVDNRILISEMLFDWGMKPVVCSSGIEALRYITGNRYDFTLGLIDICMPEMSGIELAKQIKTEKPIFPLIALSSLESFVDTRNFDYKLDKPINKIQLFNYIFKIISKNDISSIYLNDSDTESSSSSSTSSLNSLTHKDTSILIAEDFDYNRDLLKNMLLEIGYDNISLACDGQQAINICNSTDINIILLDLKMPNVDGYGVIEYLKKHKPDIKIVILTASTMEHDKSLCRDYGLKYFISKPFDFKKLNTVLACLSKF